MTNRPFEATPTRQPMLRTTALSLALLTASCASGPNADADARTADSVAGANAASTAIDAASADVQAALARMFPELRGDVTRESIAALFASRATPGEPEASRAVASADDAMPAAVATALEEGRLADAHALISELLTDELLTRASALLEAGNARDALTVLDDAADVSPRNAEVLRMRAEGALAVGLELGDPTFLEDALASFRTAARLNGDPRAWVGASRAARELFQTDEAIEYAQRALRGPEGAAIEASVSLSAQRSLAQASFDKFIGAKQAADTAPETLQELFESTRAALAGYHDRAPRDAWGWTQHANLFEWQTAHADAQRVLLEALDYLPSETALHSRLVEVSRNLGGSEAVLDAYAEFTGRHPEEQLGIWFPAVERFEAALKGYNDGDDTSAEFETARDAFETCRDARDDYRDACIGYEIVCQSGIGWCRLRSGDLEGAHKAFLAMDDLKQGDGLTYVIRDLRSGVDGLALVADASYNRGQDPNSIERADHMERASKIFDYLHAYQETETNWANNAGFFNRETAVLLEQRAKTMARQGDVEQAERLLVRARELMERSFLAYLDACELAPEDVRIVNDTGLILTHYLQRDVPQAEELLMRAVELGEEQVPEAREELATIEFSEEERAAKRDALEALEVALGDAYENLGVLHLTLKGQADVARGWFKKALEEGGPDPRPIVDRYLTICDMAECGELDPVVNDKSRWAAAPR